MTVSAYLYSSFGTRFIFQSFLCLYWTSNLDVVRCLIDKLSGLESDLVLKIGNSKRMCSLSNFNNPTTLQIKLSLRNYIMIINKIHQTPTRSRRRPLVASEGVSPFSGHKSPGFRFQFKCPRISRHTLWLPLEMKSLPLISDLRNGIDPCIALDVSSIKDARDRFKTIRASFDFPFWAATSYDIPDIQSPLILSTLVLNSPQRLIIDTFLKDLSNGIYGRYVISKHPGKIGVTTAVHAYIIWRQLFKHYGMTSFFASPSCRTVNALRLNTARLLHKMDIRPSGPKNYKRINIDSIRRKYFMGRFSYAHITSAHNENAARGIDISFVHFADISKCSPDSCLSTMRCFIGAMSGVLLQPPTLIVLEGDYPSPNTFFSSELAAASRRSSLFRLIHLP